MLLEYRRRIFAADGLGITLLMNSNLPRLERVLTRGNLSPLNPDTQPLQITAHGCQAGLGDPLQKISRHKLRHLVTVLGKPRVLTAISSTLPGNPGNGVEGCPPFLQYQEDSRKDFPAEVGKPLDPHLLDLGGKLPGRGRQAVAEVKHMI